MTMHQDANGEEPKPKAVATTVRVCPIWYELHDDSEPDVFYYTNMFGRIRVQVRHLASARMSTWN